MFFKRILNDLKMVLAPPPFCESIDSFKVIFGGENKIDAELFTKTINSTIDLIKASAHAIDPDSFLRLEIRANKEGSFETCIDAIVRNSVEFLDFSFKAVVPLATQILEGLLSFFEIKKHLNGCSPKRIESNADRTETIINHEDQSLNVKTNLSQEYFKNCIIENSIINIFQGAKEENRSSLSIKKNTDDKQITIESKDFDIMIKKNKEEKNIVKEESQILKGCEVGIKRPDLLGNSKWDVVFGKIISVKIDDEEFLQRFSEGEIKISSKSKLVCDMEVKTIFDDTCENIKDEYTIKKVISIKNIATNDEKEQMELKFS